MQRRSRACCALVLQHLLAQCVCVCNNLGHSTHKSAGSFCMSQLLCFAGQNEHQHAYDALLVSMAAFAQVPCNAQCVKVCMARS